MKRLLKIIIILILFSCLIITFQSCNPPTLPEVTTEMVAGITQTTAVSGGKVINNGGADVTARGVCWSTSEKPTINSYTTSDGTGNGVFISNLTGLTANTKYYVRAYATNSEGTGYGNEVSFSTSPLTISDADGNTYATVAIGTQIWMKENLKTTRYNNGTSIPLVINNTEWINLRTPAYCWYNNDASIFKATYGALYNWYAVNSGELCPTGWHIPTDNEWLTLANNLGGTNIAGGKLKEAGTGHWISPNTGATNESGFTALPGGWRYNDGIFNWVNYGGYWWCSTEADSNSSWKVYMAYDFSYLGRSIDDKCDGFSVRCVKN